LQTHLEASGGTKVLSSAFRRLPAALRWRMSRLKAELKTKSETSDQFFIFGASVNFPRFSARLETNFSRYFK